LPNDLAVDDESLTSYGTPGSMLYPTVRRLLRHQRSAQATQRLVSQQ